jgi:hypothetical protein
MFQSLFFRHGQGAIRLPIIMFSQACTANALYRKFETSIPRNETARPRSQFQHLCICQLFIYSHDRSTCFAAIFGICKSLTDTVQYVNVENWERVTQFHFWEYINRILFVVYSLTISLRANTASFML